MRLPAYCPDGCRFEDRDPDGTTCPHGYHLVWLVGYASHPQPGHSGFMGWYPFIEAGGQMALAIR